MQAQCPQCAQRIVVDDAKAPDKPFSVKCPKCQAAVHDGLALFDDAGNALAVFRTRLFTQRLEDLVEAIDMAARLFQMGFESVAQLGRRRGLGQLRQSLGQLFLRIVSVAELVEKCIRP